MDDNAVIVFIYCNYKAQYNVLQLLEALLKQLALHRLTPDSIGALRKDKDSGRRPSLDKLMSILEAELKTYHRVFIVVDALDELSSEGAQSDLLKRLRSLTSISPAKLMVTSRHIPFIESAIHADVNLEIIALDSDIESLVEARISDDKKLERLVTKPPSIKEQVVRAVVGRARGMYVYIRIACVVILMALAGFS